jgi:hypothetical protein
VRSDEEGGTAEEPKDEYKLVHGREAIVPQ